MFSVSLQSPVLNQCRSYLMTVENCGCNLSEYPSGLVLLQSLPLTEVIVQLPTSSYLHHQHHLLLVLKHWTEHFRSITMTPLLILPLTFVDVNDVRMLNWGHDLDLSSDPDQICLGLYLALLDGLDGHLIHYIKINTRSEFSYNACFLMKKREIIILESFVVTSLLRCECIEYWTNILIAKIFISHFSCSCS